MNLNQNNWRRFCEAGDKGLRLVRLCFEDFSIFKFQTCCLNILIEIQGVIRSRLSVWDFSKNPRLDENPKSHLSPPNGCEREEQT